MLSRLRDTLERARGDEGGAVMLLVLAGVLILFMVVMTLMDAGHSAQDKMEVQVAADTAAYSHTVVKSRSMNVISYANIIKRFFYSYLVTYVHAYVAIATTMIAYAAQCFRPIPNPVACTRFFAGLPMFIMETIELPFNLSAMEAPAMGIGGPRSGKEINQLERYQQYMYSVTPWWAWIEAAGRSMSNGAMISASWPPPPSGIGSLKDTILKTAGTVDWLLGTGFVDSMPTLSQNTDALPVVRRDRQVRWTTKGMPFDFSISKGAIQAGAEYCGEYAGSMEAILPAIQTYRKSDTQPRGWKTAFLVAQALPVLGCAVAGVTYHNDGYLDWRVNASNFEDKDDWLQSTSNISLAYKPRSGSMNDAEGRKKFMYMEQDHTKNPLYQNEGYFAVARSELVYKQPFEVLESGPLGVLGDLPLLGQRLGLQSHPDMWSPRWKAKNRPVALPGESLGSSVQGPDAGLGTVINDTIPFLMVGSLVGIVDNDFSAGSGLNDLQYLYRVGTSMTADRIEGVVK